MLEWTGTAPSFDVLRADGGCAAPLQLIGQTPLTTLLDTNATLGATYGYLIRSVGLCTHDSECIELTHRLCDARTLNRISSLHAIRGVSAGVDLSWSPDPALPPEYHVNSTLDKSLLLAPNRGLAGVTAECTVATTFCSDPDASATGVIHYQALSACADRVGEEGPE